MAEKKYVYIDVVDTALLCGLDVKPGTLGNNEVQARCPYCGDYKYRMYLSRQPEKSTFWCHNCGTGGNAVTLYADFNPGGRRLTTKEAYLELLDHPQVHTGESPYEHDRYIPEPIRPLHERSQIYLELLSLLTLEEKHRQNLLRRGLSDEIIRGNMYRSIPTNWKQRRQAVEQLASRYDLSGMPGFYTRNFRWDLSSCRYSGFKDYSSGLMNLRRKPLPCRMAQRPRKKANASAGFPPAACRTAKSSMKTGPGFPAISMWLGT